MAVPMANGPPFATLNHVAADLGIPNESEPLRVGIRRVAEGEELETNILLVSPRKCAHCCQALGGSVAQTLKMLGHQLRCAAGSPGILLSIEAKVACSVATTCAPSPTAAAPCHDQPQPRLSRWTLCTVRNQRVRQNPNRNTKTPAQKAVCSAFICLLPVKADIQNFQNLNRKHPFHRLRF